jgi:monofunctional biosynthetic peptidoglycan transglycosylase
MKIFWPLQMLIILVVCFVVYAFWTFPDTSQLMHAYPQVVYKGKSKDFDIKIQAKRPAVWTPIGTISKVAVGAILVSEDWAFYTHEGFDLNQIRESMEKNIKLGRFARGGSTITQQVARNVYLSQEKTLTRKGRELLIALSMEKTLPKKKILEVYLNIAEWGEGLFGISVASRHYFSKHPSELTAKEGAFLAMLLPSPKKYSVSFRQGELTRYARGTINSILRKMVMAQYISAEELDAQLEQRLSFETIESLVESPQAESF